METVRKKGKQCAKNAHIKNIYKTQELSEKTTIRNFRIVQKEGKRNVERDIKHYNLERCSVTGSAIDKDIPKYILWYMNTKTTILIKTDKKIKEKAQKAAEAIGIPLGTILNAYLRKFAAEQRIEFTAPLVPNARTRKALAASEGEYKRGEFVGPFSTVEEMIKSLNS